MADIVMPKFGLTMTEGLISAWHREAGQSFRKGEILFEVETEKVNNEVEATADGVLEQILSGAGETVAVGLPIARVRYGDEEPAATPAPDAPAQRRGQDAPSARRLMAEHGIDPDTVAGSGRDGRVMKEDVLRVIATPYARRLARNAGLDIAQVAGSGPGWRIRARDVEQRLAARAEPAATPAAPVPAASALTPPDPVRLATARRVQAAKRDIPHFYVTRHVNVQALDDLRGRLNASAEGRAKISVTHLLVKAVALALAQQPTLGRLWLPDGILTLDEIGVGIVTETPDGLRIPVVNGADRRSLDNVASHCADLFARAREGRLSTVDVSGGAISISNVGMFGAASLTPIINPPQAMILGVGAEQRLFRPDAEGRPVPVREMTLTLAADHRIVDGADAARYLARLAGLIENPIELLRDPGERGLAPAPAAEARNQGTTP